jgi:NADP-dependent 3-hydroxy acid dehydrogenase YdfG
VTERVSADSLTVLVTGATSGFGDAIARRFAGEGARVVLVGRRGDRLAALAREFGPRALARTGDVRDQAAMQRLIDTLPAEFAAIDLLVNNAGLALGLGSAETVDLDDWNTMIDTNVKGLVGMTRAVLPGMVARGRGHVVNIGSVAGSYPYPGGNVYGATKSFVHQFSLNLRSDLHGKGVRVTCVEPGMAETEFSLVRFKGDAEKAKAPYKGVTPMTADDIAEAVYWVATLPRHLNINIVEMMPTVQAYGGFVFHRQG